MFDELRKVIKGEVKYDEETLRHYSADASVFEVKPSAVVLPASEEDLFALVRFIYDKRKEGNVISLTARGKGTDLTGGPLSEGILVRFPGYLDKILEIGEDVVRVQPGVIYGELQKELAKKGHWIPVNPASGAFITVGGMVANNSGGTKSLRYGETRDHVRSLKVILDDGREIDTADGAACDQRPAVEKLKSLIEENREKIQAHIPNVTKNSSGYALGNMLDNFDLTQIFIGSQGTLGIIKEITFRTLPKPAEEGVMLGYFDDLAKAGETVVRLLPLGPCALEMVDSHVVSLVKNLDPALAQDIPEKTPAIILFCEFDGANADAIRENFEKARPIIESFAYQTHEAIESSERERLWKLRNKSAEVVMHMEGKRRTIPLEIDAAVPTDKLTLYIEKFNAIFSHFGFEFAVWGHAGDGNLHIRPIIDFSSQEERQKLWQFTQEMYRLVGELNGTASGEHGDGLLSTPFLNLTYGEDMVKLFREVKGILDPLGIFNPLKKTGATIEDFNRFLRKDFENYYRPN